MCFSYIRTSPLESTKVGNGTRVYNCISEANKMQGGLSHISDLYQK